MKKLILLFSLIASNFYTEEKNKQKVSSQQITIQCDSQGYPKTKALKALVTALYAKRSSQNEIFIKEISGGYYTEKMYLIYTEENGNKKPLYFFKISKKNRSTGNLIKIQEGPIGEKIKEATTTSDNNSLPLVIFLEKIFTYQDDEGNTRTIEVTRSAEGQLIKNILESCNRPLVKKCAHALGKSLATFHQLFMNYNDSDDPSSWKTVCHRDFSIKNVLFDPTTNKVYFIDNETMDEASPTGDIKVMLTSLLMFYYFKKNNHVRWPVYLEYCQSFLKGYIESYPPEHRANLALCIEKILIAEIKKKLHTTVIVDESLNGREFHEEEFRKVVYGYLHTFKK